MFHVIFPKSKKFGSINSSPKLDLHVQPISFLFITIRSGCRILGLSRVCTAPYNVAAIIVCAHKLSTIPVPR